MTDVLQWKVLRRHEGDRMYEEGDTREGTKADLGHLEGKVLEQIKQTHSKRESAPFNKAEGGAPSNKATRRRK